MKDHLNITSAHLGPAKKIGLIIIGLFLLYVIVGFWVVPPLLKTKLEEQLTDMLGRKVTITTIKLNPLVLSATTSNLMVHEKDGSPFAGFKELYVNVQASSIFRWAGTIKEIRLSSPFGILRLMAKGKMNIDDLIARFSPPDPPSSQTPQLPRAIVGRLEVIDGIFTFADCSASTPVYDVVTPITFTLENLSTLKGREGEFHFAGEGPIGGTFDLNGNLELNPLRIKGRFATKGLELSHHWEHIKDLVSFEIVNGTIGVTADFDAAIDQSGLSARLENGMVQLDNFQLTEKGKKTVLIALPVVSTKGIHADLATHEITIDMVHLADARINSWLSADGTFALQQLLVPDLEKLMGKKAVNEPETETPLAKPWQLTLKKMEAADWGLAFEDRTLTHPAKMSVDGIRAVVENLSTQKDTQATVGVTMQINGAGRVEAEGSAGIDPLQADMKVMATKIALKPFQPYVDDAVNARITSGTTSATGRIRYRGKDTQPQIRYEGEFSVDALEIQDNVQAKDFITLAQFKAGGIALELLPNRLTVTNVHLDRPHARVTIDNAGVINVVKAFAPVEKKKESGKEDLLQRLVNVLIMEFKGPMPIQVDRVRLEGLTGDFMDASVSPRFNTHMEITKGTVSGLSSASSTRADFKLSGSIDRKATIKASGRMNPMNALKHSRVDVSLKDFALKSISPYAGKYIGYWIDKGALRTELKYKIDDDQVHGDNVITIDGLKLGEAVDSPDALNLPIKLGLTLLKDKNGRIALQVPVTGDVRDPHFDFAKTIKSALTGTIEKAASEPFAAIKKIDGFTGEALRVVAFDFGFSTLTGTEIKKLNALAKYLKLKDALILGIAGTADRKMDGAAIMEDSPEQSPPAGDSQNKEKTPPEAVTVEALDNQRLEELAQMRAQQVRTYLVEQAGIDAARINDKPVQIKSEPDGDKGLVEFSLSVK
jgi:outer membrane protein OmpA-like peptidoglycan-associated protein